MSKKRKAKKVINGTFGAVWVNGEKWLDLESLELKVTINWEEISFSEDLSTHRKFMGWTGEGSLTVKKIFSRGAALLAKAVKSGNMPDITMTTKLADPDAYGTERTRVSEVTFNDFMLAKFEQKSLLTEELSFAFAEFEIIEEIKSQVLGTAA